MEELIKYLKNNERYRLKYIETNYLTREVKDALIKYDLTLHELCYRIKKDIPLDRVFTCKQCGKKIIFDHKRNYQEFCNNTCSGKYRSKSQEVQDKMKQTCLERYGVTCNLHVQEVKDKVKSILIKNKDIIIKKRKQTCLDKYGVDHPFKLKEIQDKQKQTCLKKHGKEYYLQTQEHKDFMKEYKDEIQDKKIQTCINKYGVDSYLKTQEYKDRHNEIQEKIYNTKKQNSSFYISKQEEKCYKLLLTKFKQEDILRQYKSELYPFNCDFYIKSLDLYIEYNGSWTHGHDMHNKCLGSYDSNNKEHQELLELWKSKAEELNFKGKKKRYFKTAIYTWTVLDVKKLETFKKNNLNYKIFWNIKEVEEWINE